MNGAMALQTEGLRKEYPGVVALDGVSIEFRAGEVHALIGKNGAGKSTLVKILTGAERPTRGRVLVEGREVALRSPRHAFDLGISAVHQEMSLVPALTVGENILLGRAPRRWGGVAIDWGALFERADAILGRMGLCLDVKQKVGRLGIAAQQVVEIAKAMACDPQVLFLDEPTSALATDEVESLFGLVRDLAARGVSIIYITHRLHELPRIADRISVLRDGGLVGEIAGAGATPETVARAMFGEAVPAARTTAGARRPKKALEVRGLSSRTGLHDVSFCLWKGEILGLAGLLGAGRTELLRCVFGVDPASAGEIAVGGRRVGRPSPARMTRLGVGFIPEDRQAEGLVPALSVGDNICLASLGLLARGGIIDRRRQADMVNRSVARLGIKVADAAVPVATLSGGNQQKVVVASRLNRQPQVLLFDEPTRGVDVQAKRQIFEIIRDLSEAGIGSVFVSSELEELLAVCHRILIMQNGRVTGEASPEGLSPQGLLELCMRREERPGAQAAAAGGGALFER